MELTQRLRQEYLQLFASCEVRANRLGAVDRMVDRIVDARPRYASLETRLNVPWYVVGVIHCMEATLSFAGHLHNGDPLTARTVRQPAGRPRGGSPPFSWEDSAVDALQLKGLHLWSDWSVPGVLYKLEEYNGWGYRRSHPEVLSPYLWSFSNHYTRGKFVADHVWDPNFVSDQTGAATLLRRMVDRRLISIGGIREDEVAYVLLEPGMQAQIPLPDGHAKVRFACDFGDARVRIALGNASHWAVIEDFTVAAGVPAVRESRGSNLMASIVNHGPRLVGVLTTTS